VKAGFIYLASASPRRAALLDQIGVSHRIHAVVVAEDPEPGEIPADLARRLAVAKARQAWTETRGDAPVLAADTVVALGDACLGKPADRPEAMRMLERLSGTTHEVYTAIALIAGGNEQLALSVSRVTMRPTSPEERAAYWATGEAADKAGGYAIQGRAAAFISRVEGSYSGVMGLPLFETAEMLRSAGWAVVSGKT
jgi:septum formation protein